MAEPLLLPEVRRRWATTKIVPNVVFRALEDWEKSEAFSLAGVQHQNFLTAIYSSLVRAEQQGATLADWLPEAQQILDAFGVGGGRVYSGERFSAWYAEVVFRTNTQREYAAGRYAEMFAPKCMDAAPFWLYSGIKDSRIRPEHAALDGKVFRKDDAAARRFLPPWGFNCRCSAIELTEQDVKDGGYRLAKGVELELAPEPGWDYDRLEIIPPPLRRAA